MAKLGRVEIEVAVDVKHKITLGTTPDGHPEVWLLFRSEPHVPGGVEEQEMNLWVRRCDVFTDRITAVAFLDNLIGAQVQWEKYDPIFPELWVGRRGPSRWWLTSAPLNPPGRGA